MTRAVRRLVRELAAAVVGDREDAALVRPVLQTMFTVAITDFSRYYDARQAHNRIVDHDLLQAAYKHRGTTRKLKAS